MPLFEFLRVSEVLKMDKNKYAVMVYAEGQYKFVTKVDGGYVEWNDKEKVLLMEKPMAEDVAFGLCINRRFAVVVIVPDYIKDLAND